MVRELYKITTLKGKSGQQYDFSLWTFDDFDDIKRMFKGTALYLFTNRFANGNEFRHFYIYLGETGDLLTRFDNHHKEECIRNHSANCIGFCPLPNSTEEDRKAIETDILLNNNLPCNTANN